MMQTDVTMEANLPSQKSTGIVINVSAPGKVILHGEHSVVFGRLAIAASLGLRTHLKLAEVDGENFVGILSAINYTCTYNFKSIIQHLVHEPLPLNSLPEVFNWEFPDSLHHASLLDRVDHFLGMSPNHATLSKLQKVSLRSMFFLLAGILGSADIEVDPFLIDIKSDLNLGAGTGSSASFLVTIAAGLIQYVKIKKRAENFSKPIYKESNWAVDLKQFNEKELEMISNWAFAAERIIHGTPSGIDNTICTYGSLVEFRKGLTPKLLPIVNPFRILLINTHVSRETKTMVLKAANFHSKHPDLVNNILNAMEDVAFLALKYIELYNKQTVTALEVEKVYEELMKLTSVNHDLLKALGVSHIRLDEAILILSRHGLCGKLTGAGGGGYAFALIPPAFEEAVLEKAMQELVQQGFGVVCTILGGQGVTID